MDPASEARVTGPVLFLSHAGVDTERALLLADRIEASPAAKEHRLRVWVDRRCLVPGTPWLDQLENAIAKTSTAFGIYFSSAGAENWVRIEVRTGLNRAVEERRAGRTYPFIPIIADESADIARLPPFAQQFQGVSLNDEAGLGRLIGAILGKGTDAPLPVVEEPFRGLEAFGPGDAYLFFGRDAEARELISRLKRTSLLLVVGDSGSGKSSLVKAGLVPAFREGLLADPGGPRPDPASWHVVEMRPANDPIEELIRGASDAARTSAGINVELLSTAYRRLREGDAGAVVDVLRESAPAGARVLLVIDQFEELWTQTLDDRLRETFLAGVLSATSSSDLRMRVVASMRRDYVFQMASHEGLRRRVDANSRRTRYNLRRMADAQLRECIEKPLALAGVDAVQATSLADEILRDAGDQPGDLALVEMALFKTWQERRRHATLLDAYKAIGRVEGALGQAAEEALARPELVDRFGPRVRMLAETLFVRLVTQSAEGGLTRRVARRPEFTEEAWAVAQHLATRDGSRLLVLGHAPSREPGGAMAPRRVPGACEAYDATLAGKLPQAGTDDAAEATTAELAHEQLATQWGQYLRWLRGSPEAADDKRALDQLIDRVQVWVSGGRRLLDVSATRSEKAHLARLRTQRREWLSTEEQRFLTLLRRREVGVKAAALLAVVVFLVAIGWVFRTQERQLTEALATGFLHRLTLSQYEQRLSQREVEALRELTATGVKVRLNFIAKLRTDRWFAERFVRYRDVLTRSVVGADLSVREHLIDQVVAAPLPANADAVIQSAVALLGVALETPRALGPILGSLATDDRPTLDLLAAQLAALAEKLEPDQAAKAIEPLLNRLTAGADRNALRELGRALATLTGRLESDQAARAIEPLLSCIAASQEPYALRELGAGLAVLALRLEPDQAARAIEHFLSSLTATRDRGALSALGQGFAALTTKLEPDQAAQAFELFLTRLTAIQDQVHSADLVGRLPIRFLPIPSPNEANYQRLLSDGWFAAGFAALASKLDPDQAARAVDPLLSDLAATEDLFVVRALGEGLAALPVQLSADQAATAVDTFLRRLTVTENPYALSALDAGLKALVGKLEPNQAARAIEPFLGRLAATENPDALDALGGSLAQLAGKLEAGQAAGAIEPFLSRLAQTADPHVLSALGKALAVQAGKLGPGQAARAIEPLLSSLAVAEDNDAFRVLGGALAALVGKLEAEQAAQIIDRFLNRIAANKNPEALRQFGRALAALAGNLDPERAAQAIDGFLSRIAATENLDALRALDAGFVALVGKLEPHQAARAIEPLLSHLEAAKDADSLHALAAGLGALPVQLNADQTKRVIEPLLRRLTTTENPDALSSFGAGFAALAGKLEPDQAARAIEPLLGRLTVTDDPGALRGLGVGLAALGGKLGPDQAARAIEPFLSRLAATNSPADLNQLSQGFGALAGTLEPDVVARSIDRIAATENPIALRELVAGLAAQAVQLNVEQERLAVDRFLSRIAATQNPDALNELGRGLAALGGRLEPDQAGRALLEALRNPFMSSHTTAVLIGALRNRFPEEIPPQAGLWDVFAWGERRQRSWR